MDVIKSYIKGLYTSIRFPIMILMLYAINLGFAILLTTLFFSSMKSSAGQSLELETILTNFNYTFFVDLMNQSSDVFKNIFKQIKWFAIIYWFLNIFLSGGILQTITNKKFKISDFFAASGRNFFRFIGTSVINIIIHAFVILIIYVPIFYIIKALSLGFTTERSYYYIAITTLVIHAFAFGIVVMINDYSKIYLLSNESKNIFKAFWQATKFVFSKLYKTYLLFILLISPSLAIFYLYISLYGDIQMASTFGIIIMFFIQQIFILLRIWQRVWIYSSNIILCRQN